MNTAPFKLIYPVAVERDEAGYWFHPDVPNYVDDDPAPYLAWLKDQGLERMGWTMEGDIDGHPYWSEDAAHCLGWNPESPGPDWFLLGIFDTEEGPYCTWVRRVAK
ncbi:hypothetical protein [Pseudomonas quasicaspiana]|uniref:hypothetical protein n=1 Tax=Pseudomonas quasicaspiana TaxID=2829821 RepID=UPI001E346D4E|nr:hypothetical protein [Pseudomonas quasicaspiana]MCD5980549.1 hypothetical protein [Pseudomonas quasicaspiana]